MSIQNLTELNEMHIDVLREIGNIGAGNAATSLSMMLDRTVDKSVSNVYILDVNDAVDRLGGAEKIIISSVCKLHGDIDGVVAFLADRSFSDAALKTLLGIEDPPYENLGEMELSAIEELGNIILSAYVGAISTLSGLRISISVPAVAVDMVGAVVSVPMAVMGEMADKTIFIEDQFMSDSQNASSNVMLLPSIESLNKIMEGLGIGV